MSLNYYGMGVPISKAKLNSEILKLEWNLWENIMFYFPQTTVNNIAMRTHFVIGFLDRKTSTTVKPVISTS